MTLVIGGVGAAIGALADALAEGDGAALALAEGAAGATGATGATATAGHGVDATGATGAGATGAGAAVGAQPARTHRNGAERRTRDLNCTSFAYCGRPDAANGSVAVLLGDDGVPRAGPLARGE